MDWDVLAVGWALSSRKEVERKWKNLCLDFLEPEWWWRKESKRASSYRILCSLFESNKNDKEQKRKKKNFQGFSVSLVCVKLVVPSLMLLSLAPSRCKSLRWGGVVNAWRLLIKNAHFFTLVELPRLARFVGSQWRPLSSSWMKWELQKNTTKLSPSNLRGRHEAANDSLEEEAKREKLQHQRNGIRKITNACSEFSRLLLLLGPETLYDVILLLCKREEITEKIETNFFLAESSWRKMTEIFSDDEDKKKTKQISF